MIFVFVLSGLGLAWLAWKTGVLDAVSGAKTKPGVKVAPAGSRTSLADQFLRRRINFPEELLTYDSADLRKAAAFIEREEAALAHADAWSEKQGKEAVTAVTTPLLPGSPGPK